MEKRKPMDVTIGKNMSKLRKQFNLTQREICSVVGVNTSTYKHYELGDRMVPISVLQDLAKFYKVSTNYFFENMPELSDKESKLVAATFHVINDIERIGDHAENIAELTEQKISKKLEYSNEAIEQIKNMYEKTAESLQHAIDSYENRDVIKAKEVSGIESQVDKLQRKYRDLHVKRLYDGICNAYAGTLFLDLLSNLERISDHSMNIAESVIENN